MITRPVPYSIQKTGRLLVFLALIVFSICQVSVSDSSPEITNIVFCKNVDDSGDPVDQIDMFPSGTSEIMAWFAYENIPQSPSWGYRLYQGNDLILTENYPTWGWDDNGSAHRNFTKEDGFEDGTYTLAFVMNNEEIGSGSFIVGEQIQRRIFLKPKNLGIQVHLEELYLQKELLMNQHLLEKVTH